jgi:N utilization substance protein B
MANRHQAREMAFQLVYEWSLNDKAFYDEKRMSEYWTDRSKQDEENNPFYQRVLKGVAQYLPQIDSKIESLLENWSMKRLDRVDLAVLRLAIFELCFDTDVDRPDDAVIMNEAIELAKRFGGKDSPSFVNGVLDKVAKKNLETVS